MGSTYEISPQNEKLIAKQANPFAENKNFYYVSPYINQMVYADKFNGSGLTTKLPDAPAYLANNLKATMIKRGLPVTGSVVSKTTDLNPEKEKQSPTISRRRYPKLFIIPINTAITVWQKLLCEWWVFRKTEIKL
ncbi:hypothetical protein LDL59_06790 [Kaistella anthropi]|nr:hypothetical protein [Kaistella anthropi]